MKKFILATIAIFIAWSILDMITHGMLLESLYKQTAQLWRPEAEMKMGLMYLVSILNAVLFVWIYYVLVNKSFKNGVLFGLLMGLLNGIGMGYGSYTFMPIPYVLAFGWFLSSVVNGLVAGLLVGWIVKVD